MSYASIRVNFSRNLFTVYDGDTLIFCGNKKVPQHAAFLKNVLAVLPAARRKAAA